MGLQQQSKKIYLRISGGKIRKKCEPTHPDAVETTDASGNKHYDIVYSTLDGALIGIFVNEHPEYGFSWTINVKDGADVFAVQMPENSRAGTDLLKKIPNLKKGVKYKFTPWEKEDNGKRKGGLLIEKIDTSEKIGSYYQKFSPSQEGPNKWNVQNLHGYPDFQGNTQDKDDWKVHFIKVEKFLREKAQEFLKQEFTSSNEDEDISFPGPASSSNDVPKDDDLPF